MTDSLRGASGAEVAPLGLRCRSITNSSIEPDGEEVFSVALRLWYLVCCDVTSEFRGTCDLKSAFCRLTTVTPTELLRSLDSIADAHLAVLSAKEQPSFIREVLGQVPSPIRGLVTTMERGIGRILSRDPVVVRSWRQILSFLLRPDYQFSTAEAGYDAWKAQALSEGSHTVDLEGVFSRFTGHSFDSDVRLFFLPHHGPGASVFRDEKGAVRHAHLTVNQKDLHVCQHPLLDPRFTAHLPTWEDTSLPSVLTDVPKSWKKRRMIAIEPVMRMFLQQGFKEGLFKAIDGDSFWSKHIAFSHAEYAHPLVRLGSKTGRYSTIDLSSASDSVMMHHVSDMFSGRWFLSSLMEVRSPAVMVGQEVVKSKIFGSMGNATTFPVETLIFASYCTEAILRCGGDPTLSKFRVYGDDIVVESRYAHTLLSLLEGDGFQVNWGKSYYGSDPGFREACGYESYLGHDVTPLRLPRGFSPLSYGGGLTCIASWVQLANDAFLHGLFRVSSEIRRAVLTKGRWAIPLSDDGELGFLKPGGSNCHLPSAWNEYWHRETHIYPGYSSLMEVRNDGALGLYEFLGRAQSGNDGADAGILQHDVCKRVRLLDPVPKSSREGSRVATGLVRKTIHWF